MLSQIRCSSLQTRFGSVQWAALGCVVISLAACADATAPASSEASQRVHVALKRQSNTGKLIPEQYIVVFKNDIDDPRRASTGSIKARFRWTGIATIRQPGPA